MATGILDNIKEAVQASLNVSQMKTLTNPITVDETEYSTVETALNAINSKSVDVDDELSAVSENPIQNKVITEEINKKLTVVDNMPTASAEFVGKQRLYVGESNGGLNKGGIYECRSDGNDGYEWALISTADVDLSKYKKIFTGTLTEWDELTPAEQAEYDFIATPDEAVEGIADAIIDGDMRAVTSNAVAQVVPSDASASNKLVSASTLNNRVREVFRIPYNMTITNFLARFVSVGIHVGEVFIEGNIGGTTVDSWCSYEANIASVTNSYVGNIKITNLNNGTEFLYKSYNTGSFNWVLVTERDNGCFTFTIGANQTATITLGAPYVSLFASLQIQGAGSRMFCLEYNNTSLYGKTIRSGNEYNAERGVSTFTFLDTLTFANSASRQMTITNNSNGSEAETITIMGNVISVEVN